MGEATAWLENNMGRIPKGVVRNLYGKASRHRKKPFLKSRVILHYREKKPDEGFLSADPKAGVVWIQLGDQEGRGLKAWRWFFP
jgi:hypothetical protein